MGRGLMFDRRMLIFIMVALFGMEVLNLALPDLGRVFGMQFLIYFVALGAMMVLMHWLGFLEGNDEGFRKGLMENESPFIFLPHGGVE